MALIDEETVGCPLVATPCANCTGEQAGLINVNYWKPGRIPFGPEYLGNNPMVAGNVSNLPHRNTVDGFPKVLPFFVHLLIILAGTL
jgi:hypothetical protein